MGGKKWVLLLCAFVLLIHTEVSAQYKKVDVEKEKIPISTMSVYKDYDYSFLKTFAFGTTYQGKVDAELLTAEKMLSGEDSRIRKDAVLRTAGFYRKGDGGAGVYRISEKEESGCMSMENGLYAILIPDTVEIKGKTWAVVSPRQFGARGDGEKGEQEFLMKTFSSAADAAATDSVFRGIAYLPEGEYKATGELQFGIKDINIVGEGDKSIIFTDNDYATWYEFFMFGSNAANLYLGDFRVEAREVDMGKYYRQFVFVDSSNCYMYHVNLNIPQEAFSKNYYMDKQYTNLTLYSGNKDITIDSCKLELMCGTYRGANLGILDFWKRGEENITVMNCTLHDDARDEQVGIFSLHNSEESFIRNVNFINNQMYSYQPLDESAAGGHRTMCFTVAYNDSLNVENIRIAGNHFKGMVDSQFMTFGNVKKCVIENNIIEEDCTQNRGASVFLSSAGSLEDLMIRENEIYMTRYGKANLLSGNGIFDHNTVVTDSSIFASIGYDRGVITNNTIIALGPLDQIGNNVSICSGNSVRAYGSFHKIYTGIATTPCPQKIEINGNTVYSYLNQNGKKNDAWIAMARLVGRVADEVEFTGNKFYLPNFYLTEGGKPVDQAICYLRSTSFDKMYIANNELQGAEKCISYGVSQEILDKVVYENNTRLDYTYDMGTEPCDAIQITKDGQAVTELFVTDDTVTLGVDTDADVDWYTAIESIASVDKGVVKRGMYGDAVVFAVPRNGTGVFAKCNVHFVQAAVSGIMLESEEISLEPGKKNRVVYEVEPFDKVSQAVNWKSSDENVATVTSNGIIQGVAPGTAIVTCSVADGSGISRTIRVTVNELTVKRIYLNKSSSDKDGTGWNIGETLQLKVEGYFPSEATNKNPGRWESRNEKIATVDQNGLVTFQAAGWTEIRCYLEDESCYGSCYVVVKSPGIQNIKETHTSTWVKFEWDKQETLSSIRVYRYKEETDKWESLSNVSPEGCGVYLLEKGKTYRFKIAAVVTYNRVDYETVSDEYVVTTYANDVVTSYKGLDDSIGVRVGESKDTCIYMDKKLYEWKIEDEEIASVHDESPNYDARLRVTGLKEGFTYLNVHAKDELGYTVRVPVIVYNFEKFDLQAEGGIKQIKLKWQCKKTEDIAGFRVYWGKINNTDIPMDQIEKITEDGQEYLTCTITGLSNEKEYNVSVVPYLEKEGKIFSGGGSSEMKVQTLSYVPVTSVQTVDSLEMNVNEPLTVSAKLVPENASEPFVKWIPYDDSVLKVEESAADGGLTAKLTALKPGTTQLTAVSLDESCCTKTITVKIAGDGVEEETTTQEVTTQEGQVPGENTTENPAGATTQEGQVPSENTTENPTGATTQEGQVPGENTTEDPAGATTQEGQVPDGSTTESRTGDTDVSKQLTVGAEYYDAASKAVYRLTKQSAGKKTVTYLKYRGKKTTVNIPATIRIEGQVYQVTAIAKKCFKGNRKIKKLTIGEQVTSIGKEAFKGCKKLKSIKIKTKKLKKSKVGKQSFKGIHPKAVIRVPAKKKKLYKQILAKKGRISAKVKVK